MLRAHAEMMDDAFDLATKLCRTKMVPTRFQGKPQEGTAAILYGAEVGLTPIQSMQRVITVHGMPTLEARTMVGLVQSKGYKVWTVAQSDESVTVAGRRLDGTVYETTWTIERAKRAGYVPTPSGPNSKCRPDVEDDWVTVTKTWEGRAKKSIVGNMKYITDPQTMLKAKGQAETCREIAPEVLMGIQYTIEELESERFDDAPPKTVRSERGSIAPVTADDILGTAAEPPAPKPARARKPKTEPQDVEVVDDPAPEPSENRPEPESSQVDRDRPVDDLPADDGVAPEPSPLRKAARDQLIKAIFATFGDVGLAKDENREDRLIVVEAIVGRRVESTKDLLDDELQKLRNALVDRKRNGVLEDDINEWLNAAAFKEAMAAEAAAEAAANETTDQEN
jgi:hypothetical protein